MLWNTLLQLHNCLGFDNASVCRGVLLWIRYAGASPLWHLGAIRRVPHSWGHVIQIRVGYSFRNHTPLRVGRLGRQTRRPRTATRTSRAGEWRRSRQEDRLARMRPSSRPGEKVWLCCAGAGTATAFRAHGCRACRNATTPSPTCACDRCDAGGRCARSNTASSATAPCAESRRAGAPGRGHSPIICGSVSGSGSVIPLAGTGMAQRFSVANDFAVVADALSAKLADDSLPFETRHFLGPNLHHYPLPGEQLIV